MLLCLAVGIAYYYFGGYSIFAAIGGASLIGKIENRKLNELNKKAEELRKQIKLVEEKDVKIDELTPDAERDYWRDQ